MQMPRWEKVFDLQNGGGVFRSSVPGGWLVMVVSSGSGTGLASSIVFLPNPGHEWTTAQAAEADAAGPSSRPGWEEVLLPRGIPGIGSRLRLVRMYRCRVPGGWLVFIASTYPSLAFYPDAEEQWVEDAATELEAADAPAGTGTELVAE